MPEQSIEVRVLQSISDILAQDWDALACPEARQLHRPYDPFTTHRFLLAMEQSGSVGHGTGWDPYFLLAYDQGTPIGAAPMYLKHHSQGEYIFDHNWANAYHRAGGQYYPKLQIAVPFTPATGRRLLVDPSKADYAREALLGAARTFAEKNALSSLHVTFCTKEEFDSGVTSGLAQRVSQQFHWENNGYQSFDQFLNDLSSRKRKNIKKERAQAQGFGGRIHVLTGKQIKPEHWDAFWIFYQDTGARKWGQPYLTRDFFHIAHETLLNDIVLVLAERDGRFVAGALNFVGQKTLFGRYWGCTEHHPCLHFELCYYQAIDYAIAHSLERVEAGAQGEHKLARGYMPHPTYSLHWCADPGFHEAVSQYLVAEGKAVNDDIEILTAYGPFRKTIEEEQE